MTAPLVRIGDVVRRVESIDPRARPEHAFVYIDISSVDNQSKRIAAARSVMGRNAPSRARQRVRTHDVLVATTRPYLNAVAIVPRKLDGEVCSTGFAVLRAQESLDYRYLFLFVQSQAFVRPLSALVQGALYPAVSDGDVLSQRLPLPGLAEQGRIATGLTEQLGAIGRAAALARDRRLILERLRTLIVDESFRHAAASSPGAFPINALARIQTGYAFKSEWFQSDGIRLLRNANVNHEHLDWRDTVYLDPALATNFDAFRLLEGDVVLSLDRPLVSGGIKVAQLTASDVPSLLLQRVARFLLSPDIAPEYLYFFLLTSKFMHAISGHDQSLGVPHVSPRQVGAVCIPLPPIEDQHHIVAELRERLAKIGAMVQAVETQLEALEALPAALLRLSFGGAA